MPLYELQVMNSSGQELEIELCATSCDDAVKIAREGGLFATRCKAKPSMVAPLPQPGKACSNLYPVIIQDPPNRFTLCLGPFTYDISKQMQEFIDIAVTKRSLLTMETHDEELKMAIDKAKLFDNIASIASTYIGGPIG